MFLFVSCSELVASHMKGGVLARLIKHCRF